MRTNFLNYEKLGNTWSISKGKENFFVNYAARGPMVVKPLGLRAGMPVNHPIGGPVHLPSPLNTRWEFVPPDPDAGVM